MAVAVLCKSSTTLRPPSSNNMFAVDVNAARASMLLGGSIHSIHDDDVDHANYNINDNNNSNLTSSFRPNGFHHQAGKRPLSSPTPSQEEDNHQPSLRRPSFLSKLTRFKLHIKKPKKSSSATIASEQQQNCASIFNNNDTTAAHATRLYQDNQCPVCFDRDKLMFSVAACGDRICADCMHDYVCVAMFQQNLVASSGEVECPMTNCRALMSATEVTSLLNEPERQRLQWLQTLRQIDANPTLIWCPRPGCCTPVDKNSCHVPTSAVLPASACPQAAQSKAWFVRCMCCATTFCSTCLGSPQMHRDNAADCSAIRAFLDETVRLMPDDVKHCPSCHVPVVRGDGCAQMFCWNCRHVFCWWCLSNLTDDILLMHFEKGQCQGRLGHSRPNLLWHRFQAVALVAGAGLTMITLSPLMFVAVPIYVIAKHTRRMIKKQRVRRQLSAETAATAAGIEISNVNALSEGRISNAVADDDSLTHTESTAQVVLMAVKPLTPEMQAAI